LLLKDAVQTTLAIISKGKTPATPRASLPLSTAKNFTATSDGTATLSIQADGREDFYDLKFETAQSGTFFRKRVTASLPTSTTTGSFVLQNLP
jgi:hypothetical protein